MALGLGLAVRSRLNSSLSIGGQWINITLGVLIMTYTIMRFLTTVIV